MNVNAAQEPSQKIASVLEKSLLFSGLDAESIVHISKRFELAEYHAEDEVFCEGDAGECMYVIAEGEVRILKMMGMGERELTRLGAGEHFGEMALISNERRVATVRASEDLICARLDQSGFNALMDPEAENSLAIHHGRFAQRMLKELTGRLKNTDDSATADMIRAHQALGFSLANLADSRDPETGAHLYRVREYTTLLSQLLAEHPNFKSVITEGFIESMYLVAPLHDIGKVAIPDGILLKQGKLTEAEFSIMATHTTLGAEALDAVLKFCDFEVFKMARRIILCHHERYDGKGYPRGLKGDEIPIEARIMTLADIYDALLSKRVYKPAFSLEDTRQHIEDSANKHFDPVMARVMLNNIGQFEEINQKYKQEAPDW